MSHQPTIYEYALLFMPPEHIRSNGFDLLLKHCRISRQLVQQYEYRQAIEIKNVDSEWWYEIPFAYDPKWLQLKTNRL